MPPTTTTFLIDFHRLLNVPLAVSALQTSGRAQGSGVWTVWNQVSLDIEQYYSAYATKRRDTRLSVQLATNNGLIPVNDDSRQEQSIPYFRNQLKSLHRDIIDSTDNINSTTGRLQLALRTAVEKLVTDCSGDTPVVRANLLVMILAKQNDENIYEFSDDTADQNAPKLDMRAILYKIGRELSMSNLHINVEVIKIYPDNIPNLIADSASQDILSKLSLSVTTISCQDHRLASVLRMIAMNHFDLSSFIIYNIGGMQETSDNAIVQLLCSQENAHMLDQSNFRNLRLEYVQYVRKDGIDLPKFQCLHPLVLDRLDERATQFFRQVGTMHNIILLHDRKKHEQNYHYTHAIISRSGETRYSYMLYLVCFDRSAEPEFEEAKISALELIEVKAEGASNLSTFAKRNNMATSSFMEAIIGPNLIDNLDRIKPLVQYSPTRFSVQNPATINIEAIDDYSTTTTESLERNTRWWLSFADAFDREITNNNSVSPLQNMTKAFELSSNLNGDILDLIRQELIQPGNPRNTFGDRLVPEFFEQLNEAEMEGSHGNLFSKRLPKATVRALAKKIFIALDLASRRFQHADGAASTICLQIREALIAYQNRVNKPNTEEAEVFAKDEPNNVDAAWQQINKYQNMTLREKEEALQPNIDVKPKVEPMPFANQLPLGLPTARGRGRGGGPRGKSGPAINPMFRGRRGHDTPIPDPTTTLQYPDIRAAKPWLEPVKPDPNAAELNRKRKDEQLGAQNSLLRTYWKSTERQQLGDGTNKHDGRIWVTDSKKGVRKRVKKEFDGRLDHGLATRPNSGDQNELADMLPL
ncbi:hypothetical protein NQZ79_g2271 [Umbelopsis isabellina]|nr:hypothetical protein NQZ79_g2271 [Umbelopsis isabellina]